MSYLVVNTKTAAQFTADNPVLLPNQTGIETDSLLTKIGDGQTAWNSLYYDTPVKGAFEQTLSAFKYRVPSSYAVTQAIAAAGSALDIEQVLINGNDANNQGIDNLGNVTRTLAGNSTIYYHSVAAYWQLYTNKGADYDAYYEAWANNGTAPFLFLAVNDYLTNTLTSLEIGKNLFHIEAGVGNTFPGATYNADYSANYTNRSLIDKGYAAATFAPISVTNALTATYIGFGSGANVLTGSANLVWTGTQLTANGTISSTGYQISGAAGSGKILRGNGTSFIASTATYPDTATTTGAYLRADGTNWISSTLILPNAATANYVVYATSANTYGESANLRFDGTHLGIGGAATTGYLIDAQLSANAFKAITVRNATSGTAARSFIYAETNGSVGIAIQAISPAFTTSGMLVASTGALSCNQAAGLNVGTISNTQLSFWTNNTKKVSIPAAGGLVVGTAALATTATDGFLYIPTCAGTPTGVPTAQTGTVAMVFDTTNNKLYIYDGGWLGGTTPGAFT